MPTSTITSKGQLTVPQIVRQTLGVEPGDRVDFIADDKGGYRVVALRKDARALRGRFAGRVTRPVSVQEMTDAVQAEATQRRRATSNRAKRSKSG